MSFTSDARLELARVPVEKSCDAASELCGAVLSCGGLSFRGLGQYGLAIHTESRELFERHAALMRRFFGIDAAMRARQTDRLGGQTHYVLTPDDDSIPRLMDALSLRDAGQLFGIRVAPSESMLGKDCCKRAFLRGAFLLCGSVSNPSRSYHLEFAPPNQTLATSIHTLLSSYDLPAKLSHRKSQSIIYVKDGAGVSDTLALLGASVALMELENVRILKGLRNEVNRQVNCDKNNMDKIVNASEKQISMIKTIEKRLGMDGMDEPLREVAQMRLAFPYASLTELGQMLSPPLGKSGVNARMRKLELLAESLING